MNQGEEIDKGERIAVLKTREGVLGYAYVRADGAFEFDPIPGAKGGPPELDLESFNALDREAQLLFALRGGDVNVTMPQHRAKKFKCAVTVLAEMGILG